MHTEAKVHKGNAACGDGSRCIIPGCVSPTRTAAWGFPGRAVRALAAAQPTAPGNLDRLRGMQTTSTALDLETVPQTGRKADQLRANLANIQMPPGFSIDLYAIVPDARHMAVGTNAGAVYVGTRKTKTWAVTDRTRARVADEVKVFAPSIAFRQLNGLCFSKDGQLYVAEHNRVLMFPAAEFFYEGPDVAVDVVAEQVVPKSEESFNHGARTCTIGPDNKRYVTLGQPFNVPPPGKLALYTKEGIGGIFRMDRNGKNREVFARGIRNSVGQDATYLTRQLEAFREGTRVHEQMLVIAKTLSDAQMADVAAYYNAVQVEVVNVPGQ